MSILRFPADRIVGTVDWGDSWSDETGPVLATGAVQVPDGAAVDLQIQGLLGSEPSGSGWTLIPDQEPLDLGFVRALPPDAVESVSVQHAVESSLDAIGHLAPGLRRLCLRWTDFTDAVLPTVATLTGLTYLQTFGNEFTDAGVQQLAALVNVHHLYLEEATLSFAAFDFVDQLPRLARLGLQDVPLDDSEIERLRGRLPGVDVG